MDSDRIDPATMSLEKWMQRLAEPHGAPGGGAASAVLVGIAAALLEMVAGYTPDDAEAKASIDRVSRIRQQALEASEQDGVQSAALGESLAMDDSPERDRLVREASVAAVESSLAVGRLAASLVEEARILARVGNPNVHSDLEVAVAALHAALTGAAATARADVDLLANHRDPQDDLDATVVRFEDTLAILRDAQTATADLQ